MNINTQLIVGVRQAKVKEFAIDLKRGTVGYVILAEPQYFMLITNNPKLIA